MKLAPTIFHFNCPFCGAHAAEVRVIDFLDRWRRTPQSDFDALITTYADVLCVIHASPARWRTKRFLKALAKVLDLLKSLSAVSLSAGVVPARADFRCVDCPLCLTPKGPRPPDRYFTGWPGACKVQAANLLYEASIVLFAVVRALPRWANPPMLGKLGRLLRSNYRALEAVGLMECPYCGRHTTCLYGEGSEDNPHRCRWCLDRTSPFGLSISLTEQGTILLSGCGSDIEMDLDGNVVRETHDMTPAQLPDDVVPFRKSKPNEPR